MATMRQIGRKMQQMSDDRMPAWERRAVRNAKRLEELKRTRERLTKKPVKRTRSPLQYVYFIRSQEFVKIGWTTSMETRLNNCQIGNPHPIELMAIMVGGPDEEATLHAHFRDDHHRGEWFWLMDGTKSLIDEIARLDPIDARIRAGEWFARNAGSRHLLMFPRNIEALRKRESDAANMVGSLTSVLPNQHVEITSYCNN